MFRISSGAPLTWLARGSPLRFDERSNVTFHSPTEICNANSHCGLSTSGHGSGVSGSVLLRCFKGCLQIFCVFWRRITTNLSCQSFFRVALIFFAFRKSKKTSPASKPAPDSVCYGIHVRCLPASASECMVHE